MDQELLSSAAAVLKQNDRGSYTVLAGDLYPHQWLWDSCFIAIGLRHLDIERAKTELESLKRGQWSNGMLPDMIFGSKRASLDGLLWDSAISPFAPEHVTTSGITDPPMLAEAVMSVGQKLKLPERRTWYKQMLPTIIHFHQWLYRERDVRHEGLITIIHPYESGMDNSPPWIEELKDHGIPIWVKAAEKLKLGRLIKHVRRDTRHTPANQRMSNVEALAFWSALRHLQHKAYDSKKILSKPRLDLQDLAFNCILIRANACLKDIAKTAGVDLPKELLGDIKRGEEALEQLWDEPSGQYYSRSFASGELVMQPSISTFLTLYAGTIPKERAEKLVGLLSKRGAYKSIWPVPSVPANSEYFDPERYWQGPVWVNMNWLIIQGLRRYGFDKEADVLRDRTLELVAKSGYHEYFNPLDGTGLGAKNFSWTAALAIDLLKT